MHAFYSPILVLILSSLVVPVQAQRTNSELITEIRQAYERIDFEVAEIQIQEALVGFDRFSPAELSEIHFFSALIHYARGDAAKAESEVLIALQLFPDFSADPLLTPPGLHEIVRTTRATLPENSSTELNSADIRYLILEDRRPSAAMRSMLVPGWGQMYKGERRKGHILIVAWGTTAGGAITTHFLRQNAERRYLDADTQEEVFERFDAFDRWHKVRNNLFLAASAVWLYSYIDALLLPSTARLNQGSTSFQAIPVSPNGVQFSFRYSF